MDNKEIVLFDRSIRVTSDWYVCVSDTQCAINVSDMVSSIKVEFDNDSGKIEQYCHFGVFVNRYVLLQLGVCV